MGRPTRYSPAFRAHAVAEVHRTRPRHASEWATIQAVAADLAVSAESLRTWVRQAESAADPSRQADIRRHQAEIRRLVRENSQLKRALDLLRLTAPDPPATWPTQTAHPEAHHGPSPTPTASPSSASRP